MSRGITATVQTEVEKSEVRPVFLVEFNFSTVLRFWTNLGTLTWDSETWTGSGDILQFNAIQETSKVQSSGISFRVSGTDLTFVSLALTEDVQGRAVNMWLGFVDEDNAILADPIGPFEYRMDTFSIEDDPPRTAITLSAESYLASLERPRKRRFTHDDQQIEFPSDLGLEYVAAIQNQEITWGAGRT